MLWCSSWDSSLSPQPYGLTPNPWPQTECVLPGSTWGVPQKTSRTFVNEQLSWSRAGVVAETPSVWRVTAKHSCSIENEKTKSIECQPEGLNDAGWTTCQLPNPERERGMGGESKARVMLNQEWPLLMLQGCFVCRLLFQTRTHLSQLFPYFWIKLPMDAYNSTLMFLGQH